MDDISPIRVSPRNRKRSKSESSYRQDPYYIPTPSALLKRRLKEKVSLERTGIFNETPCNRKRHNSEPTVSLSPSPESQKLNYSFSQGQIGCSRLRETGLFNCQTRENGYLHLQNDFLELNKPFRLNKQNITVSIEKALSSDLAKTEDSNIEITLGFCPEEVDRFTRLSVRDQHSQRLTEEKSLLYLLGQMNRHMSKVTSCDQSFNGLKITGMADRSKRLQLDDDDGYPLGILHLGKNRGLNLTPKANLSGPVALIDVDMKPWSFLTISSKTRSCMVPYFAPESKLESHAPDYHVIIQPCFSDGTCNFPSLLCCRCKESKHEVETNTYLEETSQVSSGSLSSARTQLTADLIQGDNEKSVEDSNEVCDDTSTHEQEELHGHPSSLEHNENPVGSQPTADGADTSPEARTTPDQTSVDLIVPENDVSNEANTTTIEISTDTNAELIIKPIKPDGINTDVASGVDSDKETPEFERNKVPGDHTGTEGKAGLSEKSVGEQTGVGHATTLHTESATTLHSESGAQNLTVDPAEDHQVATNPISKRNVQEARSEVTDETHNNIIETTSLSILTATDRTGSGIFYSEAVCVDIVNVSASSKNLVKWLRQCGLKAHPKNSHMNRAKVLAFIDAILDRKVSPTEAFLTSFTTKLVAESLDNELKRLGLITKSKTSVSAKKKILTEFILNSHKTGEEGTILAPERNPYILAIDSELKDEKPPPILSSDSSLSSSENDSDNSDSDYTPNSPKAQKKPRRRNEQHLLFLKQDISPTSSSTEAPACSTNSKVPKKSKPSKSDVKKNSETEKDSEPKNTKVPVKSKLSKPVVNHVGEKDCLKSLEKCAASDGGINTGASSLEGPLKILENSLLMLEKRVADQELITENLSRKCSSNYPSPENTHLHSKSIKTLEARTKMLSDTLNIQQNSMDKLVDRLTTCEKERKRNKDQIAQVNSVLCQHRKESKESINKIISDAELADQRSSTACGETLSLINTRVEQIERENNKCDEMFYSVKEELKGVHQYLKTLTNELSSLKANINEIREGRSISNPHGCQCHDHTILIRELQEMKADNRKFLEEMSIRSHRGDRTPINTMEEHSNTKKTDDERPTNRGILTSTSKPPQEDKKDSQISVANESKPTTNPQVKAKPEINTGASVSKNDSSVSSISGKTKDTSKPSNVIEECQPQVVEQTKPREEEDIRSRETYRRDLKPGIDHDSNARLGNVTIDGTSQKEDPGIGRAKFTTRKCLVIHDPYFKDFDKNKFSRWYDITTRRYDTLLKAKKDPLLLTEIKKLSPAVVYLHVGQADLLDQAPGNTVVSNLTWLIEEIMAKTSARICVSLIIPLSCIPQVKSVIRQVNREITNLITDLRATKRGSNRVFTQNNDVLGDFITRSTSANGTVVSLNNRGQRKLWLHLRDGLGRALDVNPHRNSDTKTSKGANPPRTETPRSRSHNG